MHVTRPGRGSILPWSMSRDRRHAHGRARTPGGDFARPRGARQEEAEARCGDGGGGEARLREPLWQLRGDDAAITSFLQEELPAWQRLQARVVLSRLWGPGRAHELTVRAFGGDAALALASGGSVGRALDSAEIARLG